MADNFLIPSTLPEGDDGVRINAIERTVSGSVVKVGVTSIVDPTDPTVRAAVNANGLKVDGSAVTQPVSLASVPSHAVTNAGTFAVQAAQSGTWTVQPGNTANTTAWKVDGSAVTQPVSAASLPLPSGASTAAKQPALGTAGSASSDVITVQGIASMTALKVDGSAVTQPVSGTVTASGPLTDAELRATAVPVSLASVPSHAVTNAGTFATQATLQAGTAEIGKLAAGVAEIGNVKNSGTFAVQPSPGTSIGSFRKTVTTAGTRVQLDSNACTSCTIKALIANAGKIYPGNVAVSSSNGFELSAGESISLDITNTNLVYIDSSVNGDGVSVVFVA